VQPASLGAKKKTFSEHIERIRFLMVGLAEGGAARLEFAGSMWRMSVISFHMVLILICFL
jgi:hypothetical protein